MATKFFCTLSLLGILLHSANCYSIYANDIAGSDVIFVINIMEADWSNKAAKAEWGYASNLTDENLKKKLENGIAFSEFRKAARFQLKKFGSSNFPSESLRRQFKLYNEIGPAALPRNKYARFEKIVGEMQNLYSTARVCIDAEEEDCDNALEPDLTNYLANSRDPELLKRIWINWRKAVGPAVKDKFVEYVELSNEAARLNSYTDEAEYWLRGYEDPEFRSQIHDLWEQLQPLYKQLHAYVRFQLRKKYGDLVSEKGPIPAHLLGNMWAQNWANIYDFTAPFPDKKNPDLTQELIKQNYTALKIFKTAEEFFKSINLTEMPQAFWENSIITKPDDRNIVCHASAWDFYDGKDFRIKQCTDVTIENFYVVHHEMGHIEYFIQYKDQPVKFKNGANNGFHEAVGDVISLSVRTTKHLRKIGLLQTENDDDDILLNNLYLAGLEKIAFLPFAYVMDLWRWDIFKGDTKPDQYNCRWWELREQYQGIEPPVDRSEDDFDGGAKYHTIADVPYIRYFVSFVIQFQFHKALCELAGEYAPNDPRKALHLCDIHGSKKAGNALKQMLELGSSRPWPDAMEVLTQQRDMDAAGLLEYFNLLQVWLEKENEKNGAFVGWESSNKGGTSFCGNMPSVVREMEMENVC